MDVFKTRVGPKRPAPQRKPAATAVKRAAWTALAMAAAFGMAMAQTADSPRKAQPPGDDKTAKTKTLEAGARLLQRNAPLAGMDIYLVGFHPMKDQPEHQMEAHHFCKQVNEDFAQCALFDGNSASANLTGIEYIISEKLFATLPEAERRYWHPHNGEILSGQLVAPGIPAPAEKALMKQKMNSYGKTWHTWNTGTHGAGGMAADKLPMGDPQLAWSFSRDNELQPGLIAERDKRLKIDTARKREERVDLQPLAQPQAGVDAIASGFARHTTRIPGVVDVQEAGGAPTKPSSPPSASPPASR